MYIMLNKTYIFLTAFLMTLPCVSYSDDSALLSKNRALTADYATQLQAALLQTMSTGGPVAAIDVCKDKAPAIQSELSRLSGANVRRTSLRFRNSGNAPDEWETAALELFASSDQKEVLETLESGDTRYMKAIPTGAVCLTCHGEELAPEIEEALQLAYPHDRARGYSLGEIRGAFSITWPAPVAD
jgi:hypothetical protein